MRLFIYIFNWNKTWNGDDKNGQDKKHTIHDIFLPNLYTIQHLSFSINHLLKGSDKNHLFPSFYNLQKLSLQNHSAKNGSFMACFLRGCSTVANQTQHTTHLLFTILKKSFWEKCWICCVKLLTLISCFCGYVL